jgi:uncharacterized protein YkwD
MNIQVMDYKKLVQSVHYSQNRVRRDPKSLIPQLEAMLPCFEGTLYKKPGKINLRTNEGPAAIKECIDFLRNAQPLPEFILSDGMSQACQDHANDIGPKSKVSHNGSDGSSFSQRLERYGDWSGTVGENCEFGGDTGDEVIISLLVDDGCTSRGHRKNIFNPEFKYVGIGCANHQAYDHCTVLDYAAQYGPKGSKSQNSGFSSNFSSPYTGNNFSGSQNQQPTQTTSYSNNYPSYSNPSGSYGNNNNNNYSNPNGNYQNSTYSTPQYNSYQTPSQNTYGSNNNDPYKDLGNGNTNTQKSYSTGPNGSETVTTTTYTKYGDSNVMNDPFIQQHLGKVKSQTDFSSNNLRDMAQKEAPPGAISWTVNSNIEICGNKKISKVTTVYKFADGSSKEITKEIHESA